MHGLFNYDGPVVQIMNKVADCICLSFLWLVCALPIVTVGAATSALYYAMNKSVRRSEGGVWKNYWHGFRENFKQSTVLWLILFGLFALMFAGCYSSYLMCVSGNLPAAMFYFSLLLPVIAFLWACFIFPYAAKFQNSTRLILKNCIYIALMNFPIALLHLFLLSLALVAAVVFPLAIIFVPGIYTVLSCYALEPVFRKYMTEEDRIKEEEKDQE